MADPRRLLSEWHPDLSRSLPMLVPLRYARRGLFLALIFACNVVVASLAWFIVSMFMPG
jgi:hypothetical protein